MPWLVFGVIRLSKPGEMVHDYKDIFIPSSARLQNKVVDTHQFHRWVCCNTSHQRSDVYGRFLVLYAGTPPGHIPLLSQLSCMACRTDPSQCCVLSLFPHVPSCHGGAQRPTSYTCLVKLTVFSLLFFDRKAPLQMQPIPFMHNLPTGSCQASSHFLGWHDPIGFLLSYLINHWVLLLGCNQFLQTNCQQVSGQWL